jgi:hypothetical protein
VGPAWQPLGGEAFQLLGWNPDMSLHASSIVTGMEQVPERPDAASLTVMVKVVGLVLMGGVATEALGANTSGV